MIHTAKACLQLSWAVPALLLLSGRLLRHTPPLRQYIQFRQLWRPHKTAAACCRRRCAAAIVAAGPVIRDGGQDGGHQRHRQRVAVLAARRFS